MPENVVEMDQRARSAVNRVFATLKTSYPAWYEKHYGAAEAERLAKRVWITGVRTLTDEQVNRGLQRMVLDSEYPPTLHVFIAMCRHIEGLPDPIVAWMEALRGQYSHEAVEVAARLTGVFDLRQSRPSDRSLQQQFERHYDIVRRRLQHGEPLDGAVATGIGHDSQKTEAELAQEHAEQLLHKRIEEQGIPRAGGEARKLLLARLGLSRNGTEARA